MTVGEIQLLMMHLRQKLPKLEPFSLFCSYIMPHSSFFIPQSSGTRYHLALNLFEKFLNKKDKQCVRTPPFSQETWSHFGVGMESMWFRVDRGQNKAITFAVQISFIASSNCKGGRLHF